MTTRAALILFVGLAGCTLFPLSEADCKPPNWRSVGYADGFSGAQPQDMRLMPECRERYGVEIDRAEYLAGWKDGHNEWDRLIGSMDRRR